MAYVREGSEESQNKLRQFLRKKVVMEELCLLPARIIAECCTSRDREVPIYMIDWLLHTQQRGYYYKISYRYSPAYF